MTPAPRLLRVAFVIALAAVVSVVFVTASTRRASAETPAPRRVLVLGVPGLQWRDLTAIRPPALDGLLGRSAVASMSIRTVGPTTTAADAFVTIGAGNRADVPDGWDRGAPVDASSVNARARSLLYGAKPGSLTSALKAAGKSVAMVATNAAPALAAMDRDGNVSGTWTATVPEAGAAIRTALSANDVVIAELSDGGPAYAEQLAAALTDVGPTDLVILLGPNADLDRSELTAFAIAGPGIEPGLARSATTRRAGYVTLPDIAPTILHAFGITSPQGMNGTPITSVGGRPFDDARARSLAHSNDVTVFRDRAVGPVSVVFIVVQVIGYGIAALAVGGRRRWRRGAYALAMITLAVPLVAFLSGLANVANGNVATFTVAVMAVAAVVAASSFPLLRVHRLAPPLALIAANTALQIGDIVTGGHLQLNTVFGYSPVVAGRFAGYGNLAFGLVAMAAITTATGLWALGRLPARRALVASALVLAAAVVADGAPSYGSDVGGVLALAPASAVVLFVLAGRKVSGQKVVVIALAAAGLVGVFAVIDYQRPDTSRTHLG
ncbi:MAG: hypothetical protein AB7O61_17640, partial [Acidimicrobiia bacterium]